MSSVARIAVSHSLGSKRSLHINGVSSAAGIVTVSFIVVNWNGGELLRENLASIRAQLRADDEVLLFDNGSSDGSADDAARAFPEVKLLRSTRNLGFAEANNRALTAAQGELIALVNNDATLDAGWRDAMVDALHALPHAGAAACRTVQRADASLIDSAGFAFYTCGSTLAWRGLPSDAMASREHRPFGPVASAAMYRRAALQTVGLFHPEYFCYYEDTDLAVRLVLFGYETVYVPDAVARHLGSHSGQEQSDFHVYHLRRNVEYLYWVDMVGRLAWIHLPHHVLYETLALLGAVRSGQAQVVLRAKRDAIANARWVLRARRQLSAQLVERGATQSAQRNLLRAARHGLPLLARLDDLWRRSHSGGGSVQR
jgi:GT2 family glycosyltransferase